jgi:N-acetylglutamate synthase-like GNAT family acetyltransferase
MSTPSLAVLEVESRPATPPVVVQRYRPGSFGRIVEMHASYYSGAFGFGLRFEAVVASGLAEFAGRLERPRNAMWCALEGDRIVGSVAIDGEDLGGDVAHLRCFIVDSAQRGAGVGCGLLAAALAFVDGHGFERTDLWTFRGLDAARRLYERVGFACVEENLGHRWGGEVLEQRFVRPRLAHDAGS